MHEKGMNVQKIVLAVILAVALPLCNTIALVMGVAGENPMMTLWPGYLPLLLFMIGKERTFRDFLSIIASGIVGILTGVASLLIIHVCSGYLPALVAMIVGTFVAIVVFSLLKEASPTLFNNYGFLYFLVSSTILASNFDFTLAATWGVSTVVCGAAYTAITFGAIKLFLGHNPMAMTMKSGEQLEAAPTAASVPGEAAPAAR